MWWIKKPWILQPSITTPSLYSFLSRALKIDVTSNILCLFFSFLFFSASLSRLHSSRTLGCISFGLHPSVNLLVCVHPVLESLGPIRSRSVSCNRHVLYSRCHLRGHHVSTCKVYLNANGRHSFDSKVFCSFHNKTGYTLQNCRNFNYLYSFLGNDQRPRNCFPRYVGTGYQRTSMLISQCPFVTQSKETRWLSCSSGLQETKFIHNTYPMPQLGDIIQ